MNYNGSTPTLADLNSGDIKVTVSIPGAKQSLTTQLVADGYYWIDENGNTISASTNVGTYKLKPSGWSSINSLINNSAWKNNISRVLKFSKDTATFTINPKPINLTQAGSDSKTYDGNPGSVTLDQLFNNLTANSLVSGKTLDTIGLSLDDFAWSDADHTNVGKYTVNLTEAGLKILQDNNKNYSFGLPNGSFEYEIVPSSDIKVDFNADAEKTYDGTPIADYQPTVTITAPGISSDPITLTSDDYKFVKKDSGSEFTTASANAGTYDVVLTQPGINKIKGTNSANLDWSKVTFSDSIGTYTIDPVKATGVLSGEADLTYDGSPVNSAQLEAAGIKVNVTIPVGGKDTTVSYWLHDGDYTWNIEDGKAPADVGIYTISLNKTQILSELQNKINNEHSDLAGNYTLTEADLSETATVKIDQKDATVVQSGSNKREYNGNAISTADVDGGDIVISGTYQIGNATKNISYKLHDGDYTLSGQDPADKNVGTYTINLTDATKTNIQNKLNNQYGAGNVILDSVDGDASFEITPFKVTITVNGTAHVSPGTTTIPDNVYSLNYGNQTMPTGWQAPMVDASDFDFTGDKKPAADTVSGTYTVNYKGGQEALQQLLGKNYVITYKQAENNYIVDTEEGHEIVQYVDANDPSNVVGHQELSGNVNEEVPFTADIPDHWKLADGEQLPSQVQIENGTIQIKVVQETQPNNDGDQPKPDDHPDVSDTKPDQEPDKQPDKQPEQKPDDNLHLVDPAKDQTEEQIDNHPQKPNAKALYSHSVKAKGIYSSEPHAAGLGLTQDHESNEPKAAGLGLIKQPQAAQVAGLTTKPKSAQGEKKEALPQTGAEQNSFLAAIGSLLASLGIFGLAGKRKKKDE